MGVTWRAALESPDFWCWYWLVDGWRERTDIAVPEKALRLGLVGQRPTLVLNVTRFERTLYLDHPSLSEKAQLGWLDDAHWHPDVLRWEETECASRYLANAAGTRPRPSEALLLLAIFTPVTRSDDCARVTQLLDAASVEVGIPSQAREHVLWHASSPYNAEWRRDAGRWVLEGEVHSLRYLDNPSFPFQELQELSALARQRP